MLRRALFAAVLVTAGLVFAAPASAQVTQQLDSAVGTAPYAGPSIFPAPLAADTFYIARVRGTASTFAPSVWSGQPYFVVCGTPDRGPLFASPGQDTAPAGLDAETVFATVAREGCGDFDPPVHHSAFQVNTGSGYSHPEPIGGPYSTPTANSAYRYVIRGEGALVAFRLRDNFLDDNNGRFRITLRVAGNSDCSGTGWQNFGVYSSRAQCRQLIPEAPPSV